MNFPGTHELDDEMFEKCRAYLKLLACSQIDTWLERRIDASDLVQQTLLDAVARRHQFRGSSEAELLAWLRTILTHNLVDTLRHYSRVKRNAARDVSLEQEISQSFRRIDAILLDPGATPSQRASINEQLLRLPAALDALPQAQRQAIVLHHLQGLTLAETAVRLGRTTAAVGGLLHRGLKRLHELFEDPQ